MILSVDYMMNREKKQSICFDIVSGLSDEKAGGSELPSFLMSSNIIWRRINQL